MARADEKSGTSRRLMRCQCGRLFWSDAPQEILRAHLGHHFWLAQQGSLWEWLKIKLGLLNIPTRWERRQAKCV